MFHVEPMKVHTAMARITLAKLNVTLKHVEINTKISSIYQKPAKNLLNNENYYFTWKIFSPGNADFNKKNYRSFLFC